MGGANYCMLINIENNQNQIDVTEDVFQLIRTAVEQCIILEEFKRPFEVNIYLVDNANIRDINRKYRNIDRATDVLSFPMVEMVNGEIISLEGDIDMDIDAVILGDIVISMEKVLSQADEFNHSLQRELAFLVTHGIFHILGYDHEIDEQSMFERQEEVLHLMGLSR